MAAALVVVLVVATGTTADALGLATPASLPMLWPLVPTLLAALIGAELLRRGHRRLATAGLGTAAAMFLPLAVASLLLLRAGPFSPWRMTALLHVLIFAALVTATVAGRRASPDWPPRRTLDLPPLLAGLATLGGTVFPIVAREEMRDHLRPNVWELPRAATAGDPASAAVIVLTAVVLAAVLLVAMTSARRLGALIVLVAVGPGLASDLVDIMTARSDPSLFVTLVGWLALVGQGALLVVAATWWSSAPHLPRPEPTAQPAGHR